MEGVIGPQTRLWRICYQQRVLRFNEHTFSKRTRYLHTFSPLFRNQRSSSTPSSSTHKEDNHVERHERNILSDESIAEEDAVRSKTDSLLERQRNALQNEPVWSGDERVQDTILRMLMDKYQPLKIKGQQSQPNQHPADAKLASIQKPNMIFSPSVNKVPGSNIEENVEIIVPQNSEDGRRLAKTPADKPWRAVYINPMIQAGKEGEDGKEGSIYYARYIGLPTDNVRSKSAKTASGKDRLKLAGIKTETLPLDDRNKMRAIREGVRRWDRAGRMRGVKEEAMQYRRMREEERERGDENDLPLTEEEIEKILKEEEGVLQEGQEMRLSSASDSKPGEAQIAMLGGRGFQSLANEKIEAAMKTDYFRRNTLRGKPLVKDVHESNPFLKGEERIMNRIIQRQGAAPPWVELNVQLENEQSDFRKRLSDSWLRRASRMILSSSHLRSGLESISIANEEDSFENILENDSLSSGQRKLLNLVNVYKDLEWEQKEQAYHDISLRDVNNLIRKYNIVAPVSARRGLLIRDWEIERSRKESRMELARRLSEGLQPSTTSNSGTIDGRQTEHRQKQNIPNRSNIFASWLSSPSNSNSVGSESDLAAGRVARSIGGQDDDRVGGTGVNENEKSKQQVTPGYLSSLVRRTAQRARQLVNW